MSSYNIGLNKVIWSKATDPTPAEIVKLVKDYLSSRAYQYLGYIGTYYDSQNEELHEQWADKKRRNKKPNWYVPTAYYSTLVDTLAGYLFSNIVYAPDCDDSKDFAEVLNETFKPIDIEVTDIKTAIRTLAFNKGAEIVYTEGDGVGKAQIKCASVDPRQMLFVYSADIEPKILYGIRIVESAAKDIMYDVDFVSAKAWLSYQINKKDEITENTARPARVLVWSECPCIEYNTETINGNTAFHQVLPYIAALDALFTGNANEIDKLADAILKLSATLSPEQKQNMSEMRVIEGMAKEDIAEYINRNTDPTFREFCIKYLIQETHKHSHVLDFYSPDSGITGDASGKALKTRLIDMNMACDRIEKTIKLGWNKRVRLFREFLLKDQRVENDGGIKIIFNRTPVVGPEDIAPLLQPVTFMSDRTKQELSGLDPEEESERIQNAKDAAGEDITDMIIPLKGRPGIKDASAAVSDTETMSE